MSLAAGNQNRQRGISFTHLKFWRRWGGPENTPPRSMTGVGEIENPRCSPQRQDSNAARIENLRQAQKRLHADFPALTRGSRFQSKLFSAKASALIFSLSCTPLNLIASTFGKATRCARSFSSCFSSAAQFVRHAIDSGSVGSSSAQLGFACLPLAQRIGRGHEFAAQAVQITLCRLHFPA